MGILSVVFFYLFTNFGWWLTFEMYPLTLQGLIECYIAGLPFLKNQLFSSLIFVPAFALIFSLVENRELGWKVNIDVYGENYENLEVWRTIKLATLIYGETKNFPGELYGLTSQLRRAVISISSNIARSWSLIKTRILSFY